MMGFNLSEWALKKHSLVVFLMIIGVVAGVMSFLNLGRGEDPAHRRGLTGGPLLGLGLQERGRRPGPRPGSGRVRQRLSRIAQ